MSSTRTMTTIAATAGLMLTALATAPAQAAQPAAAPASASSTIIAEHVGTRTVLQGRLPGVMGNQHRLTFWTDTEGMQYPAHAAKVQSYFCPSGTRITPTWSSKSCVHRTTSFFTYDAGDVRVSDTLGSARVETTFTSGTKRWGTNLAFYASSPVTTDPITPGVESQWREAKVYGTVGGVSVRPDARSNSNIHRYVRR